MHKLFILLGSLFSLSGISMAEQLVIPADKHVIEFETKLGTVTFQHKTHAELSVSECSTCHHKLKTGDTEVEACSECHGDKDGRAPRLKTAFHTTCTNCHEDTGKLGEKTGPVKKECKLCHVK